MRRSAHLQPTNPELISALELAGLENVRDHLVRTLLSAPSACEGASPSAAQLLLSAPVHGLMDLDGRLHEARSSHGEAAQPSAMNRGHMTYDSKISAEDAFPEDLRTLDAKALHVLNSKVHRELDAEYLRGGAEMETEFRSEEVREELGRRESTLVLSQHRAGSSS